MDSSSDSSSAKVPVFIETTLKTHIVVAVAPDSTVKDLKSEFGKEHHKCFPNQENIRITGLMVKRKSNFYHLPDSMLIKDVFHGRKGIWFLFINAHFVSNSGEVGDMSKKGNKMESNHREEEVSLPTSEIPSLSPNEITPTRSIITRYFPEDEEVTPHSIKTPGGLLSRALCTEPKQIIETSRGKFARTEVGKRVAVAASYLRLAASNKTSMTSACRSTVDKFPKSLVRNIVFEVGDIDD